MNNEPRVCQGELKLSLSIEKPSGAAISLVARGLPSVPTPPPTGAIGTLAGFIARRFFPFALVHQPVARNAMADAVCDLVDVGSANASGSVRIFTEGKITQLSEIALGNPAFGTASNGVCQALSMPRSDLSAANTGVPAEFEVLDRDRQVLWTGTIDLAGADLDMAAGLEIVAQDIVKINSMAYSAAP